MNLRARLTGLSALFIAVNLGAGCSTFAYENQIQKDPPAHEPSLASFRITHDRKDPAAGKKRTLFILAFSGGGSRSAYLATSVMFSLQKLYADERLNLLKEVDAISAVSGGTLPAAYYAITADPGAAKPASGRYWEERSVRRLMRRSFISRFALSFFLPHNFLRYWFTSYDRSDLMAQRFADNLFDTPLFGFDLKFKDINPERPNLIINATNATGGDDFGNNFTFTEEDFRETLCSDIGQFRIAKAVMASSAFPAVFHFVTQKNYRRGGNSVACSEDSERYVHLFDGGNNDNLGLKGVSRLIETNADQYDRFVVILVDAYINNGGVSESLYDPRGILDYTVNMNITESTDVLLRENRANQIHRLAQQLSKYPNSLFYHINFANIKDPVHRKELNSIPTNFRISRAQAQSIDRAVQRLIVKENRCLIAIKDLLSSLPGSVEKSQTENLIPSSVVAPPQSNNSFHAPAVPYFGPETTPISTIRPTDNSQNTGHSSTEEPSTVLHTSPFYAGIENSKYCTWER
jgi:predicted acylesterase/phospholipase RssA